jgi:MtrB/PioB family decaheme-associated outer membrane protein
MLQHSSTTHAKLFLSALCCLPLVNALSTSAFAQDSSVSIGAGYSSEDSYRFGQYSSITGEGAYGIGSFLFQGTKQAGDGGTWQLRGDRIGLETTGLEASYRRWDEFSFSLNYEQLPHYRFNDGYTPFIGSGSMVQTLPPGWTGSSSTSGFSALGSSLNQVNVDTRRDRVTSALQWHITESWQLQGEFRHETKQGSDTLAAIFGSTGGNPRGSVLVRPVDYQIDEFDVSVTYAAAGSQFNLGYNTLRFSNGNASLRFDNPFNNSQWAAGANFSDGAVGQIGLEPDNVSQQYSLSGTHSFGSGTRLSGSLVSTRLEQDDSFLPYSSVFPAPIPLPRSDLGGRVDSLLANLRFATRVSDRGNLNLHYYFRERDNRTPQAIYLRIPGDATPQGGLLNSSARVNRIYDLEQGKLSADFRYRLSGSTRLNLGLEFEQTDRSMLDVATTEEERTYARLSFKPTVTSSAWIKLARAERDSSTYDATAPFVAGHNPDYVATLMGNELFENDPLLRRYHLTARDRDELSASFSLFPWDQASVSFLAILAMDDYPEARIGLQESDKSSYSLDFSFDPAQAWQASVFYTYDNYQNRQAGYARLGGGNPTPFFPESLRLSGNDWWVSSEDRVHSIGSMLQWSAIPERLDLSFEASYSDANTMTQPLSRGQRFLPLPDVSTEIVSAEFSANYRLSADRELSLGWYFERFQAIDWSLDSGGIDALSNILLPGNLSPNYSAHFISLSLHANF